VTAQDAGSCDFTFHDNHGQTATLHVDVTTTKVIIHQRKRPTTSPTAPHPPPSATPAAPTVTPKTPAAPQLPVPGPGTAPIRSGAKH